MAWHRPGDEPLSEPMMIIHWRIYASLGLNEFFRMAESRTSTINIPSFPRQSLYPCCHFKQHHVVTPRHVEWNHNNERNFEENMSNFAFSTVSTVGSESSGSRTFTGPQIDGFAQERRNSIANALELRLSCPNPSRWPISDPAHVWDLNPTG